MRPPNGAFNFLLGYGAGLMTGLSRFTDPRLALITLLAAVVITRRRGASIVFIAVALGLGSAQVETVARRSRCSHLLPLGEMRVVLQLLDPGAGGGRVELPGRCRGRVNARWPAETTPAAGESVAVVARWLPRQRPFGFVDGTLVVRRIERRWGTPGPAAAIRNRVAIATDALYGHRAPLVEALVIGWRGELPAEVRASFAAAGLVHLLAISGFHVGLLAGWVLLALHLAGVRRHPAEFGAALAAFGYAVFLGWPAPAARAALLALLLAFCRWRQRQVAPRASLALSAALLLASDPAALVSVGAWLSVLALAGLTTATRWSDRALGTHPVVRSLAGSVGATLATAPLSALVFGQVAPIGILLNLLAVPLTALLVPALLASLALSSLLPAMAAAFAASGGELLALLQRLAEVGAAAPGAGVVGGAGIGVAWPWLLAAGLAAVAVSSRSTAAEATRRLAWGGVAALWLTVLLELGGPTALHDGRLALVFADVGQGDATLIRTPAGHWVVVDVGPADDRWNAGERVVLPLLRRLGARRIEALVLSHAHRDHVGGAAALTGALPIGIALEPGEHFDEASYRAWLEALASRSVRWHPVAAGDHWELDGVSFRLLHPPRGWSHAGEDLNEDSAVLEVRWQAFRAVLMGDAGLVTEAAMAGRFGPADLLKVGHHGSRTASSAAFLEELQPQAAIISVGRNRYGHPTGEALGRLAAVGARIWRTDRDGAVTVESDGSHFTVSGASGLATYTAGRRAAPRRRRAPTYPGHHTRALHPRPGALPPRRHG